MSKSPSAFQGPSQAIGQGNLTSPQVKPDEDVRQTFMREMYKQTYLPFSEYPFLYDNPSYLDPNNPTGVPVRGGDLPPCAPTDTAWYDMWYKLYGFYPPGSTQTNCQPQTTPPVVPGQPPIPVINPEPIPIADGAGGWEGGDPDAGCWPCPAGYTCTAQCYPKTGPVPPYYQGDCNAICSPFQNTIYYDKCKDGCKWGCPPDNRWSHCKHACVPAAQTEEQVCPPCYDRPGYRWSPCKHTCVPQHLTEIQICPPAPPPPALCSSPPLCKSSCHTAECTILKKWKELACKYTKEADRACPGYGLGGRIVCSVKQKIAEAWVKNYGNQYRKCGAGNMSYRTRVASSPGVGYAFYSKPRQRPVGEIIQGARGIAIA